MPHRIITIVLSISLLASPALTLAKDGVGCPSGKCDTCHSLTVQEAAALIKGVDRVLAVEFSEVPGFWAVDAEKSGQKFPIYIDFSKSYVVAGNIIKIATGEDLTQKRINKLNNGKPLTPPQNALKKVDPAAIPHADSIVLGKTDAKTKIVVFTDPECPYCKKLHVELKEIVQADPSIAFYIKLMPLIKIHPNSYGISKTIVCSTNPLSLLEAGFSGVPVAQSTCATTKIDENLKLSASLGVTSTPTLILPDGTVLPGYKKAGDLLKIIGSKAVLPDKGK